MAGRSRALLRTMAATLGGFLVFAFPWYAWTIHLTGDPVYPFATGIFGNRGLWTPAEIQLQNVVARAIPQTGVAAIVHRDVQYLLGEVQYDTGTNRSPLSWLLGLGFLGLLVRPLWRDRTFLGAAAAGALCAAVSAFISADPRYLVPAIGLLALAAGLAADHVLEWSRRLLRGRLHARLLGPVWAVLAVAALWSSGGYALQFRTQNGSPPTTSPAVANYLAARIPCYSAVSYLNEVAGVAYRAWGYACEQARYYAHGRLIGDAFSEGSRSRIFDDAGATLPSDYTLWARLTPLDVQWVILPIQNVPHPRALEAHGLFKLASMEGPEYVFLVHRPTPA
jgi:hypothetical protein